MPVRDEGHGEDVRTTIDGKNGYRLPILNTQPEY